MPAKNNKKLTTGMPAKNNKKLTTGIAVSLHYNIFYLADISTSITSKDG